MADSPIIREADVDQRIQSLLEVVTMGVLLRNRQKHYFKTRNKNDLILARQAEVRFDKAAEEAFKLFPASL